MATFLPQEFIRQIRDGQLAADSDIQAFISGIGSSAVSDAQVAAFAMAVFFNDFPLAQRMTLTTAMRDSGEVLQWDNLNGPVLDKHSTGGVGDNVSLLLAPIIAACGGFVPMISGRGLGHTGGTLDKFDAIPGYNTTPNNQLFRQTVQKIGCAIIGQTDALAPADQKIYAIRSATATVENITLITASILSKKLAAGLEGLVLDIKCGSGATMNNLEQAGKLANSLVSVANAAGVKTSGLITDMNESLATAAGNALEVLNAVQFLTGQQRDSRLQAVTFALAEQMLVQGGLAATTEAARKQIETALGNGTAAEVFAQMVAALGGPKDFIQRPQDYLLTAPLIRDITADCSGIISAVDARQLGLAVIVLGGGRKRPDDIIDSSVGFDQLATIGTTVKKGDTLARIHANAEDSLAEAEQMLKSAYQFSNNAQPTPLVLRRVSNT
ncbi:MAG: thymidine phosphorylase [Xanthomonadales bacterium]|nr:thymidine phosphorylase [Xanthomonadales bacterium]